MFSAFETESGEMPVTDWLTERVISLPIHTEMDDDQLQYITASVSAFINTNK